MYRSYSYIAHRKKYKTFLILSLCKMADFISLRNRLSFKSKYIWGMLSHPEVDQFSFSSRLAILYALASSRASERIQSILCFS